MLQGASKPKFAAGLAALCWLLLGLAAPARATVDHWTSETPPIPEFGQTTVLEGIACPAANQCTAIGYASNFTGWQVTLAEIWSGGSWAIQETPNPPGFTPKPILAGISCASTSACVAVGSYKAFGVRVPMAMHWNGTSWSLAYPPRPEGAGEARLEAVSCTASNACTGAGYYQNSENEALPLVVRWNGTSWALQTVPKPEGSEETVLRGISCSSSTACTGVGSYKTAGALKPVAAQWNGTTWEAQIPPAEKMSAGSLEAVSCVSGTTTCVATGWLVNGSTMTLAEHWNGEKWEQKFPPNPEKSESASLDGISCGSKSVCIATGDHQGTSTGGGMAVRWDGSSWELHFPKSPVEGSSTFPAVSCAAEKSCMAAGFYEESEEELRPLTASYARIETPVNTAIPVVSPTVPETGKAASATTGTWTNEPTSYSYQWKRCNGSGLECVNIAGATGATYYPLAADVEKTLKVEVTASNLAGNATAASSATEKVKKAGLITEFALPVSSHPRGIAPGSDEKLWFADSGTNKIGKITTAGSVTEYAVGAGGGSEPMGITNGPDGNLWFSFSNPKSRVAKVTTSGTFTQYELSKTMLSGREIAKGPDGNLWFTATEGRVGKITTSGTFTPYEVGGEPTGVTAGPDGNVWVTENSGKKIAKLTTSGTVTEYSLPFATLPWGITSGPDEKLWFGASGKVGKISTAGTITEYNLPVAGEVRGITEGPDGLLWFAHYGADRIGKITTGGTVTEYSLPPGSKPWDVAAGSDGNVWFTLGGSNRIGMIEP